MFKEIDLRKVSRFTCPHCGGDNLTLTRIYIGVGDPRDDVIEIMIDPLHLGGIHYSGVGGRPSVTLCIYCPSCADSLSERVASDCHYLEMVLEEDGHTRVRWETDWVDQAHWEEFHPPRS